MKYMYIICLICLMCFMGCTPDQKSKPIRTYKVVLNNGKEYTVKATGFYTHHKFDSVQTVFQGGSGSFFNVSAVVEIYE